MAEGGPSLKDVALGVGIVGLAGVAGVSMADKGHPVPELERRGAPHELKLDAIIRINTKKDGLPVNFRSSATIPDPVDGTNIIPPSQIDLGNGKTAADVETFYVSSYMLEDGYQPDKSQTNDISTGVWLDFPDAKGQMVRMSLSPQTWDYWKVIVDGKTKSGSLDQNNNFVTTTGDTIQSKDIGQISLDNPAQQAKPQ